MENETITLELIDKNYTSGLLDMLYYNLYKEENGANIKTLKLDLQYDELYNRLYMGNGRVTICYININCKLKVFSIFTKCILIEQYEKEKINREIFVRLEKISYICKKIKNNKKEKV